MATNNKVPYGFICNHNYHVDGHNKDIFFSFRCIGSKDKLSQDDKVSFMIEKNEVGSKLWAANVKKIKEDD